MGDREENHNQRSKEGFRRLAFILPAVFFVFPAVVFATDYSTNPNSCFHDQPVMPEYVQLGQYADFSPINTGVIKTAAETVSLYTDKHGNQVYRLSGKPMASVANNGDVTYLLDGGQKSHKNHVDGMRLENYSWKKGQVTVTNVRGEVVGYEEHNAEGITKRFDSHGNLTHEYYNDDGGVSWEYDVATKIWKKMELGRAVEERRGGRDGELLAYWKEDGDYLWRIEMTCLSGDDGIGLEEGAHVEGNRQKFDVRTMNVMEEYDREGNLIGVYSYSEDNRLEIVVDPFYGTYKLYDKYERLIEEGILRNGREIVTWRHTWDGMRHLKAYEQMYDPFLTESYVDSGKYRSYSIDGNVEEEGWEINEFNKPWFDRLCQGSSSPFLAGGDEIAQNDYVYFYEVKDLDAAGVKDFFNTTKTFAESIYNMIQEYKKKGKAAAGLFCIVSNNYTEGELFLNRLTIFSEYNDEQTKIRSNGYAGVSLGEEIYELQSRYYLERGEYASALTICEEFERECMDGCNDFDNELGKLYLKVLNIKVQALEKMGLTEDAQAARDFITNNFSLLADSWGQEYVETVNV